MPECPHHGGLLTVEIVHSNKQPVENNQLKLFTAEDSEPKFLITPHMKRTTNLRITVSIIC